MDKLVAFAALAATASADCTGAPTIGAGMAAADCPTHGDACTVTCDDPERVQSHPAMCLADPADTFTLLVACVIGCVSTLTPPTVANAEPIVCAGDIIAGTTCPVVCKAGFVAGDGTTQTIRCDSYEGRGFDVGDAACVADSGTTAKVCSGAIPTATLGNSKADCADATAITAKCNVTCDDVIKAVATCTANADATMDPSYVTNPATLPDCAAPAENPLCDGKWTDSDDNAGSTVDCTGVEVAGKECAVACLPQLMEFGLPPKCGTLGYSKGGLCVPIAPTDAQYEKAGCKVRVATGAPLAIKLMDLLGGKKTMSLRQVMQLTSASVAQIAAGKQLSEAAFMTAIKGGGVTEAQLPDLKELMCIGSNFVTAAVALAVAFLVSK